VEGKKNHTNTEKRMALASAHVDDRVALVEILNHPAFSGLEYVEPFVGGANVLRRVRNKPSYLAFDVNEQMIEYLHSIGSGNSGLARPGHTSRARTWTDRQTIALSFNAFRGASTDAPVASQSRFEELLQNPTIRSTEFHVRDYRDLVPWNKLVFCHPPLYKEGVNFHAAEFWQLMRAWSRDNVVLIQAARAPSDFEKLSEANDREYAARHFASSNVFAHTTLMPFLKLLRWQV
jgi:hypothetical protein